MKQLDSLICIDRAKKVRSERYDYSFVEYRGALNKVKIICQEHGVFEQRPNSHTNIGSGCPLCSESNGERAVDNYLSLANINSVRQYKFSDCRNIYSLPFDFYLPEHNTCIEYDGRQHFESIKHFGGLETLEYTRSNDEIKNKYCVDNGINLIRIKYDDDIKNKLKEIACERGRRADI